MKLSVIVPVYNAEKYISKCLDSILCQTFTDFEVLIINDGSTDQSLSIIQNYSAKDERIRIFSQNNRGVSAARNLGLQNAQGDFFSMIDADDFIEPTMFETLLDILNENEADIAICGMNYYSEKYEFQHCGYKIKKMYNSNELLNALWEKPNKLCGSCANKIFRNLKSNQLEFNEKLKYCEDILFLLDNFPLYRKGVQIDECLYNVVDNNSSATRKNSFDTSYRIISASDYIQKYARAYSKDVQAGATESFLDNAVRYAAIMKKNSKGRSDFIVKVFDIKTKMLKALLYAVANKLLSKSIIHGYFYEMLKL